MYSDGIKLDLSKKDIDEAIKIGKESDKSVDKFFLPYRFGKLGAYYEWGMIFTKVSSLVFYSAVFGKMGDKHKAGYIDRVLADNNLGIMVSVYGSKANFNLGSWIFLKQGKKTIEPKWTAIEKQTEPTVGFVAIPYCIWFVKGLFRYTEIDLKAKTTIIVRKGRTKSTFEVDLSKCK